MGEARLALVRVTLTARKCAWASAWIATACAHAPWETIPPAACATPAVLFAARASLEASAPRRVRFCARALMLARRVLSPLVGHAPALLERCTRPPTPFAPSCHFGYIDSNTTIPRPFYGFIHAAADKTAGRAASGPPGCGRSTIVRPIGSARTRTNQTGLENCVEERHYKRR